MSYDLQSIFQRRDAESRSITAENPDGGRGAGGRATPETTLHPPSAHHARELGQGWKLSPCRAVGSGESIALMSQEGPGVIRHVWFTLDPTFYRDIVIRIFWDGQTVPSVEAPIGDFFCAAWNSPEPILAIPINVNPTGGLNCYMPMPFRQSVRIEVSNDGDRNLEHLFYCIDYTLETVPSDALYFHAQFRRSHRVTAGESYAILDDVKGDGHYVGTFMAWKQRSEGWWGEGEIKMYLDGDDPFPTICGTGTEDYFGGAWCFGHDFSAPFLGYRLVSGNEGKPGAEMIMYRFHIPDPVFFKKDFRATMQALGWQSGARYLPLDDDLSSVAYWYQSLPTAHFPVFPDVSVRNL